MATQSKQDSQHDSKPTPGPWHVVGTEDNMYSNIQVLAEDNAFIVRVNSGNHANVANARLIAAAPRMYEACKVAEQYLCEMGCDCNDTHKKDCVLGKLQAAIAKAEGRE
jgi:hypothetical protein